MSRGSFRQLPRAQRELLRAADHRARLQLRSIRTVTDIEFSRCFRRHLQTTVGFVSPLVFDVLAAAGVSLNDALHGLRPGPAWLRRDTRSFPLSAWRKEVGAFARVASDVDPVRDCHFAWLAPAQAIAIIRPRDHPLGYVGLRVVDRSVEVITWLGGGHLSTQGGMAWLNLGYRLPDGAQPTSVNRPLSEFAKGSMFSGRDYVVCDAFDLDTGDGSTVLMFHTGLAKRSMPWPELLLL